MRENVLKKMRENGLDREKIKFSHLSLSLALLLKFKFVFRKLNSIRVWL